jgi:signal transduction histidine kinase
MSPAAAGPYDSDMAIFVTSRRRRHPLAADLLFTAVLLLLTVLGSIGESHPNQGSDSIPSSAVAPWPAYLLVAAGSVALFWRHRRPDAALAVALVSTLVYTGFGYENGASLLNPAVALYAYAATARTPRARGTVGSVRAAVATAVLVFALLLGVTAAANPLGTFRGSFTVVPADVAVALLAGLAVANQRAYVEAIRARAELAEQTREDEARRRVDAERLRIARELHDVVAHTMSTINLRAGVTAHVSRDLPEQVADALGAIRDASKNGLRELRAILAVLRQVDESEPTGPIPDLRELPLLIETVRSAGLPVELEVVGEQRALPAAIELAAYRIVQESLTNTLRHAGPATAIVRLDYADGHLDLDVVDTGTGSSSDAGGAGHGLIGMRERALAAGGTLEARPGTASGFHVNARLPWGEHL